MAAAPGGEDDDRGHGIGILAGERQRAPAAGRMADDDGSVLPNERLLAQKLQRERNLLGGGAARARIVGLVTAALVLQIGPAGGAVTEALGHHDGKAARDEVRRQRAI